MPRLSPRPNDPKSGSWVIAVRAESAEQEEMDTSLPAFSSHPVGEQPSVEGWSTTADTFAGRVRVRVGQRRTCDGAGPAAIIFIDWLKQGGTVHHGWVGRLPTDLQQSERTQQARLAGRQCCRCCRAITAMPTLRRLRYDAVSPWLLGHEEGDERGRGCGGAVKIDGRRGLTWLQTRSRLLRSGRCQANRGCWTSITRSSPLYGAPGKWWWGYRPHKLRSAVALLPHLPDGEPSSGAGGRCAAGR